jgi:hypothetical protein
MATRSFGMVSISAPPRVAGVSGKAAQIARVDAHDACLSGQRARQLVSIGCFDHGLESAGAHLADQAAQLGVGEYSHQQQNVARTDRARAVDLDRGSSTNSLNSTGR